MHQLLTNLSKKIKTVTKRVTTFSLAVGLVSSLAFAAVPTAQVHALSLPQAKVSFTFDDGLASAIQNADPILKAAGFAGTDYVISGCVGMTTVPNTCHANPDTPYMTWAQINQLQADGWEIGDHTVDHACLASSATQDPEDCSAPYGGLTAAQVNAELVNSQTAIKAQTGSAATDLATPYGDWTPPVLAEIAQVMQSHRGFADNIDQNGDGVIDHGNTYPYNDYLLYDLQVQGDGTIAGGVTVQQVESYIDQTIANNQWLVLTFHNILPNASADPSNYEYSTANFQTIVNYVKSKAVPVVTINQGLATNNGNLLPNSSFNTAISSNTADQTVWSTDSPSVIKQDTGTHGNYPDPTNSVLFSNPATDASLFSPVVPVVPSKTYVLKNYLNIQAMSVAAGHEFAFYIDEYDANGTALPTRLMRTEVGNAGSTVGAWVESLNFEYKPSGTNVAKARLRVVDTAGSATTAYLDNVQWFAEDGSTTGNGTVAGGGSGGGGAANTFGIAQNTNGSTLASAQNADGTLELFGIGNDGNVYMRRETAANTDTWGAWTPLQGGNAKSITATKLSNGELAVFFVAKDGTTHYYFQTAASTDTWTPMAAMTTGLNEIAASTNSDGTVELFAVGNDGNVYGRREASINADSWNAWYQLQGGNAMSVSAGKYSNGKLGVFFVAADGGVHYYNQAAANNDTWTAMEAMNSGLLSVNVATNADGTLELFAVGNDGNLYGRRENGINADSWNMWYQLQGGNGRSITANPMQNGKLGSFFIATDGAVHYYFQAAASNDTWAAMEALGN